MKQKNRLCGKTLQKDEVNTQETGIGEPTGLSIVLPQFNNSCVVFFYISMYAYNVLQSFLPPLR
jgi:hypothetical protein